MAQIKKSVSFKNAIIDMAENTITEIGKDDVKTYDLSSILSEWNGVEGVTISIQQAQDIPSAEDEE